MVVVPRSCALARGEVTPAGLTSRQSASEGERVPLPVEEGLDPCAGITCGHMGSEAPARRVPLTEKFRRAQGNTVHARSGSRPAPVPPTGHRTSRPPAEVRWHLYGLLVHVPRRASAHRPRERPQPVREAPRDGPGQGSDVASGKTWGVGIWPESLW